MFRHIGMVLTATLLIAGCNAVGNSPVNPDGLPDSMDGTHISGSMDSSSSLNGAVCWGLWEVTIDPLSCSYEVVPLRTADFMANVTMFLQPPAGSPQNFILKDLIVDMDSQPGYVIVDVDVGLRHPFPGLDQYTGFDVRGIFMHDHGYMSTEDDGELLPTPDIPRCLNADGYSRWMNASEFTTAGILGFTEGKLGAPGFVPSATINPYKYFADGLEPDGSVVEFFHNSDNTMRRGYFRPGSVNYRHYELIWPDGPLTFQYAVIASYEESNPVPPVDIPDDFPLSANCDEAFHIEITNNGSTAYYESPDSNGGDLHLNLEIFDWGVLDGGTVSDEIGQLKFESLGSLFSSVILLDTAGLTQSAGCDVSSVYQIDISGVNPSGISNQTVLIRVTSAVHDTYDYGFGSAVPNATLAAYMMFDAPILEGPQVNLPTAIAAACDCLWIAPGESITFDGNQSWSPNGMITDYEWDFDGDGNFGDAYTGTADHPIHIFDSAGDFNVNLRVTDELGFTDTLDEPLVAHVGSWTPPTASSRIVPTIGFIDFAGDFEGSGSTGTINLYEWDFESDCIWDYQHPTIGDTTHAYTVPDIYDAILRVTGNGCDSVSTEVRMIEPLGIIENGNFWDSVWNPWEHGNSGYGNKSETIEANDTYKRQIHFLRTNSYNDGGICWARQTLDEDVSMYDSLDYNFFFNLVSSSCPGDGWMGGELDMAVRIVYDDGTGFAPYWRQAWFGWDRNPDGHWEWDTPPWYVTYHEQEGVASGVWLERTTGDLMVKLDPPPLEIKWIQIDTSGWDFNTYFALPWFEEE